MRKKIFYTQSLILAGGVFFSWSALASQFRIFYDLYGSFFRFRNCVIPNPMATPCFYGSLAFLVAFVWSVSLISKANPKSQRWLRNFLLFCVFFALSVLSYEALEYYSVIGNTGISCSPGVHPLRTPCFYGFLFFTGAFATAVIASKISRNKAINQ